MVEKGGEVSKRRGPIISELGDIERVALDL